MTAVVMATVSMATAIAMATGLEQSVMYCSVAPRTVQDMEHAQKVMTTSCSNNNNIYMHKHLYIYIHIYWNK